MKGLSIAGRKVKSGFDLYQTPAWATEALLDREQFRTAVWEPACGLGAISDVLRQRGYFVYENDIQKDGISFLNRSSNGEDIITNPPYYLGKEFVEHALKVCDGKIAMLFKLSFLESETRKEMFKQSPLKVVYVFSKRVQLYPEGKERPKNSGTIAYAWFVWDKEYKGRPYLDWI